MYTYTITHSKAGATWGNGNSCTRLAITNEHTGETKVCDDFTYLEDDTQENLEYLFANDFGDVAFEHALEDVLLGHLAKLDAQ